MFDIGATELLLVVVVAILVIGPKDMPLALRTAGRWVGKLRRMSAHFRAGVDNIVREAELEDMEAKWKAQNEKIMREHPEGVPGTDKEHMEPTGAYPAVTQAPTEKAGAGPTAEDRARELKIIAAKQRDAADRAEREAREVLEEIEADEPASADAPASTDTGESARETAKDD